MDFDTIFETKKFKLALGIVGILIVICGSFMLGMFVGYHKAQFSYSWGENYDRNFGGPPRGGMGMMGAFPGQSTLDSERGFSDAHGTSGAVLSIGSSTLVVSGENGMEKKVLVSSSTVIRSHRDTITFSDIKPNDQVVVLGNPNAQGQIEAQLIRLF